MKKIYFIFFNILTIIIYLIFYTACSTTQERDEKESLYEVEKKESALEWGLRPDSAKSSTEGIEPKVKFKTAKEKIGEKVAAGRAKTTGKSRKMRRKISSDSGLKAGFADDNKQFNYFINFLNKYKNRVKHYPINITERIILKIFDKNQKPIPNVKVAVYSTANKLLCRGLTYSDGTFLFFPSQYAKNIKKYKIKLTYLQNKKEFVISRYEKRKHNISFNIERKKYKHIPLDILFIFDTTGSMGEEINRLKATLELIYINLEALKIKPKLRFGMVLYRDKLDEYITKVIPLTENLEKFRKEINKIEADGGGDTPEDLQSAL
ncbi:MAG TPA: VWA domain-containing protein, partial [Candidatus Atribacteria bacterium]|nr:VWA domain-containing protein [Candidatus Atribacteria bacterium]